MELDLIQVIAVYAVALLLAWGLEFALEAYIVPIFDNIPYVSEARWLLRYLSLGLAIFMAFFYKLDAVELIRQGNPTPVGMALTGAIIGGGADAVHTLFRKYILKEPTEG